MSQLDHGHVPNSFRTSKALPVRERGLRSAVALPLVQSSQKQHCKNPIRWISANRFESTADLGRSGVAEAFEFATRVAESWLKRVCKVRLRTLSVPPAAGLGHSRRRRSTGELDVLLLLTIGCRENILLDFSGLGPRPRPPRLLLGRVKWPGDGRSSLSVLRTGG